MSAELSPLKYSPHQNFQEWVTSACKHEKDKCSARILVVDDENGPRQALRMLLQGDYEVSLACDVPTALQMIEEQEFNLIITDIRMPKQTGVDLLRIVKERQPDVEVIILTGYAHLDTAMKAVEYGAFVYLEKPFDNDLMLQYVAAGLERNRAERDRRVMERLAIEANRFETLGRLVSGIMHDLGTPLSVIGSQIEIIMMNPKREDIADRMEVMHGQVKHCNDMVRSTMSFLRQDSHGASPFCLNNVVETCLDVAYPSMRGQRIQITRDLAPSMGTCMGELVLVRQAILNLVTNACHAMKDQEEASEIVIRTWMEGQDACVSVRDTGPGIPLALREKIFETFFTTKAEAGTGLGLAVVRNVMRRHKGSVTLAESDGRGAEFILRFPTTSQEDMAALFKQS